MKATPQKKRILITGSTGFLGKAIIAKLGSDAYELVTPRHTDCDLTSLTDCLQATTGVDTIIHTAGLVVSRGEQQKRPAEVFSINTLMAIAIAEAARQNGVRRVIFISSVTAYPDTATPPFSEECLWAGPINDGNYAYGTAKRITETIARSYREQYELETSVLFLPNLYGPQDKFKNNPPPLIASIITQIQKAVTEQATTIRGGNNGDVALDLLYVKDAAAAVLAALQAETLPPLLNIGTGATVTIREIFTTIAVILGYTGLIEWEESSAPTPRLMDTTGAQAHIGWKSETSFTTGIKDTITDYLQTMTSENIL
jgi:GDP-L-fucose synthase